jgi:hypothetical protein
VAIGFADRWSPGITLGRGETVVYPGMLLLVVTAIGIEFTVK